jgi:hypothetical protein
MFNPKSGFLKNLERSEKGKVRSQEWGKKTDSFTPPRFLLLPLTLVEQQPIRKTGLLLLYNL